MRQQYCLQCLQRAVRQGPRCVAGVTGCAVHKRGLLIVPCNGCADLVIAVTLHVEGLGFGLLDRSPDLLSNVPCVIVHTVAYGVELTL